jgi:hypothetical protein
MRFAAAAVLACCCLTASAAPFKPDFTSAKGFARTCGGIQAAAASGSLSERQAYVICADVALLTHIATFMRRDFDRLVEEEAGYDAIFVAIREELTYARQEVQKIRAVLQGIEFGPGQRGLLLRPGAWQIDLNGDGHVNYTETDAFAIPRRRTKEDMKPASVGYSGPYRDHYNRAAAFQIDQSDLSWLRGYHYLAEGVLEVLSAYRYEGQGRDLSEASIKLNDAGAMHKAHALFIKALQNSEQLRIMVLAEKDDVREWLPSPVQRQTSFPFSMGVKDFDAWQELIQHLLLLLKGETLLPRDTEWIAGSVGRTLSCGEGKGLNVARVFLDPPTSLFSLLENKSLQQYCEPLDGAVPASGIYQFLERESERVDKLPDGVRGMARLFWVN